jgi:hypothetical protein
MVRPFVNDVYNLIHSSLNTGGSGVRFKTLGRKNAIKHEKGTPTLDFLTTPITPSKEFDQNPKEPPWIFNFCGSVIIPMYICSSIDQK